MNGYTCQAGILYTHTSSFHIITLQLPERYTLTLIHLETEQITQHTLHSQHTHDAHSWNQMLTFSHLELRHRSITHN